MAIRSPYQVGRSPWLLTKSSSTIAERRSRCGHYRPKADLSLHHMNLSKPILLPFSLSNFLLLLQHGANPSVSPYSHKQIVEWCDKFWCQYLDLDAPAEIEAILPLLTDVETQWDLYLANTFTIEQLRSSNFENENMPIEWFEEWLDAVRKFEV